VSNSLDNTISVINSGTNTVMSTITLQIPRTEVDNPEAGPMFYDNMLTELAVSPDGSRLYAAATDGSVTVINTAADANTVLRTASLGVVSDLKISPDGRWLYATPSPPSYTVDLDGHALAIVDTTSMTATWVNAGPAWDLNAQNSAFPNMTGDIALSADGKRAYVIGAATTVATGTGGHTSGSFIVDSRGVNWLITGGYSFVAVVDVDPASVNYGKTIATIHTPKQAQDIAVSGTTVYAANADGTTVSAIDTTSNTLLPDIVTDQTPSNGRSVTVDLYYDWDPATRSPFFKVAAYSRYVTAGPDGTVYVTDYDDGALYAISRNAPAV
jgi:DNA-binding beta-propeller fold protein YncE